VSVEIRFAPKRRENEQGPHGPSGDESPCFICGRGIATPKHWIHVHEGGSHAVTEDEAGKLDPGADLGCHPIGADCLARRPELRAYVLGNEAFARTP
jgi:hypothetical protein